MPRFATNAVHDATSPEKKREGLLLIDSKGRIAGVDEGFSDLLRYEHGEIVGKRYTRLFTPMQVESRAPEIAFFLANKEGVHVGPVWRQQKGKAVVPLQSRLEALRDAGGTVRSHLECLQPQPAEEGAVPETTSAGEAVLLLERAAKERFPRIVLAGCDASWITGWPLAELIGREWDFLFADFAGEARATLVGAVLGGLFAEGRGRLRRKDGGQVETLCRIVPLDAGSKPTQRFVMRFTLLPAATEPQPNVGIIEAVEVAQVADSIANEFNNLLHIMGEAELASLEPSAAKTSRLKHIEASILRAVTLTRHLMMIGKGEAVAEHDGEKSVPAPGIKIAETETRVPFFPEWMPPTKGGSVGHGDGKGPQSSAAAVPAPVSWPKGTETILIVDDNLPMRRLLAASLRTLGYRIIEVGDQEAATAVIRGNGPIDLLVADMVLPSGSGEEVVARYRETHEHGAVLYISGYSHSPQADGEGKKEAFLSKPFTPLCLARKIREILGPLSVQE